MNLADRSPLGSKAISQKDDEVGMVLKGMRKWMWMPSWIEVMKVKVSEARGVEERYYS